jgi:ATP-binding protein involved in chromosome partitioning
MSTQDLINTILNDTRDPVLHLTLQDMGIQPIIRQHNNALEIEIHAGFPVGALQNTLLPTLQTALNNALPDYAITLTIHAAIKTHRTQLIGRSLRGIKNTIAIASGKGGVGKSTVAVNLAVALAKMGARVGILDADIYGPSIPLMLGSTAPVTIEDDYYLPIHAHGIQAMSMGFLTTGDEALIWRGPMLAKSLIHMLDSTKWDDLDYLFIDLPPGTGDIQLSLVQKIPLTAAIIVTTPQTVATLDAQKALQMFDKTSIHVLGIIENMALHTCGQCGHRDAIFGQGGARKLCDKHHIELLGQLPLDARIATQGDEGTPTATNNQSDFLAIALRAAVHLSQRPLNYADKFPPIVAG